MATSTGDLSVRSHERVKCALPAELWVGERSQDAVRLTGAARNAHGAVAVTVVDCSLGGLGLSSPVYLPKACRLRVRVDCPRDGEQAPRILEAAVAVQRATMTDRSPSYYLGCSFEDGGGDGARALMESVRRAARAGEGPRA